MLTLQNFLADAGCEAHLARLLGEFLPKAVKQIRDAIEEDDRGFAGTENASGESQLALDVRSNQIVMDVMKESGMVSHLASEELEDIVEVETSGDGEDGGSKHTFAVAFDPLDGSSLVDVNLAVGSIFGFYESGSPMGKTGDQQLASAFVVYGPRTTMILTTRNGVDEFRMGRDGIFYVSRNNIRISDVAKYFAPGNLRAASERADYLALVENFIKRKLTLRYSGGMVPDVNHIFLKGSGIFTYPGYSEAPDGKLRLLFECNPMALLAEQAGGAASDGTMRILEKPIVALHQRTPILIGSKDLVREAEMALGGRIEKV